MSFLAHLSDQSVFDGIRTLSQELKSILRFLAVVLRISMIFGSRYAFLIVFLFKAR